MMTRNPSRTNNAMGDVVQEDAAAGLGPELIAASLIAGRAGRNAVNAYERDDAML
jgi:hypothetical protein